MPLIRSNNFNYDGKFKHYNIFHEFQKLNSVTHFFLNYKLLI